MTYRSEPSQGVMELDIHGMTCYQAKTFIESKIRRAPKSVYQIKVIHGYNGGTALRNMVRSEIKHNPKVLRVEAGLNQGETTLILRELF